MKGIKLIGLLIGGGLLFFVVSRLSPDAIGMAIGVLFGILAGAVGALIVVLAGRTKERERERYQPEDEYARHRLPQPPIVIIAPYVGRAGAQQGQFQITARHDDIEWQ